MTRPFFLPVFLFALLLLAACHGLENPTMPGNAPEVAREIPEAERQGMDVFKVYKLSPGDILDVLFHIKTTDPDPGFVISLDDVLEVKFVHAQELNEKQQVRPDGTISLPYLGETQVAGVSVGDLTSRLTELYTPILRDPTLYVIVSDFRKKIQEFKNDLHTAPRGLSRLTTVAPDGNVTFPLLGSVFMAGKSISEANELLNAQYDKTLKGLTVDLFLEKHGGALIYVLGEIEKPGTYEIRRPISVMEAIAMAGNHKTSADLTGMLVIRRHKDKVVATRVDVTRNLTLEDPLFLLQPDDVIYLPRTPIAHAGELVRQLSDLVLFRGWNIGFSWEIDDRALFFHDIRNRDRITNP